MKDGESTNNVVTIDIQPFLMPISILLSTIIFSISFIIGMNSVSVSGTNSGSTAARREAREVTAEAGESLTYEDIVETIEADVDSFVQCFDNRETEDEVNADLADGTASGVNGTPGFIIGNLGDNGEVTGVLVSGAQPYNVFESVINAFKAGEGDTLDATLYPKATTNIDDDPMLGESDAPIVIVEFTDFECPFCQRNHEETYPEIITNFVETGDASYVLRDFPLSFHNPVATDAAIAANCVYVNEGAEAYYEFIDIYFANTKTNGEGL
jgi:protein-disulfide isomerase